MMVLPAKRAVARRDELAERQPARGGERLECAAARRVQACELRSARRAVEPCATGGLEIRRSDRMDEQEDMSRTVRDKRFRCIRHGHPDRSPKQPFQDIDEIAAWSETRRLYAAETRQLAFRAGRPQLAPLRRSLMRAGKPDRELTDVIVRPARGTRPRSRSGRLRRRCEADGLSAALRST